VSFDSFNLDARLMRAVNDAGYETPTPIQAGAIPVAMTGQDLIGTAQTGTGKTAAFVLPILQHLLRQPTKRGHRALIVCPTRELAEQINDTVIALARHAQLRSATIYGGVSMGPQESALRAGVPILVACPGRLLDHVSQKHVDFSQIDHLILDEADRMFDMGFLPQVKKIVALLPHKRQTMLFSATMPKEVEALAHQVLRNPQRISMGVQRAAVTVAHALYPVPPHLKTKLLLELITQTNAFSMLVFTRTKHRADKLARVIGKAGFEAAPLHGDRSQNQRQRALDNFKTGKVQVLVATDIASRGIDVESISHVINFDVPGSPEDYIHRIGRTGRAERTGDAFTLITPEDGELVRDIEKTIGKAIERKRVTGFDYNARSDELAPLGGEREAALPARERVSAAKMAEEQRGLNSNAPGRESSQDRRNRVGFETDARESNGGGRSQGGYRGSTSGGQRPQGTGGRPGAGRPSAGHSAGGRPGSSGARTGPGRPQSGAARGPQSGGRRRR
jgi:ATP-dependent RNA helicase RhlE